MRSRSVTFGQSLLAEAEAFGPRYANASSRSVTYGQSHLPPKSPSGGL
ncbi:MAG: hypothetical protein F6K37_36410 [Moorea sp. SIO4E2]|nr:hypothetical protein [Moorena sp. SIO4E2]